MANNFCPNCGEPVAGPDAKVCTNCGKPLQTQQQQTESTQNNRKNNQNNEQQNTYYQQARSEEKTYTRPENVVYVKEKTAFISLLLSFFFPGAGQVYNGNLKKGMYMIIGFWIGLFILFIPGIVVLIYSMYDAYKEAERINRGELPFIEPTAKDALIYAAVYLGSLFAIYIIFAILMAIIMIPFMMI